MSLSLALGAMACRSWLGIHEASAAERAKATQLVGPFELRDVSLERALQALVDGASIPVTVAACSTLGPTRVTVATVERQPLGELVRELGVQLGAHVRVFVGHHSEVARPTIYCSGSGSEYLEFRQSK